ncbi:MAG TPA: RNA 2',3'-cyclic phosphodiesterase [Terriglobales bacterium]|jgi:2'-5' RNA ligase|nr:RNA 2',3'-cyclic phosphodiesterase [Terriglobales bacterium]
MRLFVALDIDPEIRRRIARFLDGVREFAPDARWVRAESLHLTLKFIGEQPDRKLDDIRQSLADIRSPATALKFHRYGFFPTVRSARVFWIGVEADEHLANLARSVEEALEPLGIKPEGRDFSPHLTLARGKSAAPQRRPDDHPNRSFQQLQEKLSALPSPEFGTMSAREFFLYQSKLSPAGSQYTQLQRFPLL